MKLGQVPGHLPTRQRYRNAVDCIQSIEEVLQLKITTPLLDPLRVVGQRLLEKILARYVAAAVAGLAQIAP